MTETTRTPGSLLVAIAICVAVLAAPGCETKGDGRNPVSAQFEGVEAMAAVDAYIGEHPVDKADPEWKTRVPRPPFVQFDPAKKYYWTLSTSEGLIKIELWPQYAPHHVSSTIYLTRLGFYDGLTFHRIIPGFMAQGGDPLGTGRGGPGYRYASEIHKKAKHDDKGIVSMANSGRPRSDGSQFFILFKENPGLDEKHTVFGKVVEGRGTLQSIERFGTESGKPRETVTIRRAEVFSE